VEDFARRQPVLFIAGTVAIGFALARFLKSSSRSGYDHSQASALGQGHRPSSHGGTPVGRPAQPNTEFSRHMATPNPGSGSTPAGNGRRPGQESG
jgi:hypothetical protein